MLAERVNLLPPDRYFDPEPQQKKIALDLYAAIEHLPIVSPHGHVDPALFSDSERRFGDPVELLIRPDHYVLRMLQSQGLAYEKLLDPNADPRVVWQTFADHFYLFRATPSGAWLVHELAAVFGIEEKLTSESAQRVYDHIAEALASPAYAPRALYERLNIEVLATTDAATDTLTHHQAIRNSGWPARIIPTFRPDNVFNLDAPDWTGNIQRLGEVSGVDVGDYASFIRALERQRERFRALGATATDFSQHVPAAEFMTFNEADALFGRALAGRVMEGDAARFSAHMLGEMARMSTEDGLVLQLHSGVLRNHHSGVFERYGTDRGFDIPVASEFTRSLRRLLERYGHAEGLTIILFTLDESTYARELAPLAGVYPAVRLGPPWWFHDSWNGMRRYFDQVIETAGLYNTAGFNDDTRAFLSIPARHDVWRRASANWLGGLVARHVIDRKDAESMAVDMAVGLARRAYKLGGA